MMTANQIRQAFIEFFASKQHEIVESAPMVLKNDPTLMFTNAGMNQFKDYFLGNSVPKNKRIADTQKCLRVSGKHNDLEEVGIDTYHHTMFEMLGNWSIGDYFKKEAIDWGWEFLTDVLKIDKERLYVTYFGGDESDKMTADTEAADIWKQFVAEERILPGSKKDNFWEMGDTGPCGPCSEIHIDMRSDEERKSMDGAQLVNADHPQVIEIWNLVFIQFNRLSSGELQPLPEKHVDTGMGFERLVRVIQKKTSNYDTDVFMPLIHELEKMAGKNYGKEEKLDISFRVIADHVRAVAFAIADGQLPANAKAGYVIRRILRRAIRYGYSFLDFREPFIYKLVPVLSSQMGEQFPELKKQQGLIEKVIQEEENSFLRTLENGIHKFEQHAGSLKNKTIDGAFTFELYDTFGFPIDLTQLLAREKDLEVDFDGFTKHLNEQKQRSKKDAVVSTGDWTELLPSVESEFIGYDNLSGEVRIAKYRKVEQKGKEFYQLVFDTTPFYAESGGQVGDTGYIEANGEKISIENTLKELNLSIHIVKKLPSDLKASFTAFVNEKNRISTMRNHSATHLLHEALREVLGTHVEQKGSLVNPDYLRFDFAHFEKLSAEEIAKVEHLVNSRIREDFLLEEHRDMPIAEAQNMGAMALFGEKYGDSVRVIKFGSSVELCGGCHVKSSGTIGFFKIISESAIAAGIRRIEAITGVKAEEYIQKVSSQYQALQLMFKGKEPLESVEALVEKNNALQKEIEQLKKSMLKDIAPELIKKAEDLSGIKFIAETLDVDGGDLKDIAFGLRNLGNSIVAMLFSIQGEKVALTLFISDNLVKEKGWNAGQMIREVAKAIQGGGGGQPFLASAGGTNKDGIDEAVMICRGLIG
ncbi:MAG: alanine--tRNA ligase [Bacteroidales bacterium]|nr:alanine--tRNA ligase [Bacteroidales bacterium]